jgi:ferritin
MKTAMTRKLQKLLDRLTQLKDQPEEEQDRVATQLLEDLETEGEHEETPLADMIGAAPGLFNSPEEADQFIRRERSTWE